MKIQHKHEIMPALTIINSKVEAMAPIKTTPANDFSADIASSVKELADLLLQGKGEADIASYIKDAVQQDMKNKLQLVMRFPEQKETGVSALDATTELLERAGIKTAKNTDGSLNVSPENTADTVESLQKAVLTAKITSGMRHMVQIAAGDEREVDVKATLKGDRLHLALSLPSSYTADENEACLRQVKTTLHTMDFPQTETFKIKGSQLNMDVRFEESSLNSLTGVLYEQVLEAGRKIDERASTEKKALCGKLPPTLRAVALERISNPTQFTRDDNDRGYENFLNTLRPNHPGRF